MPFRPAGFQVGIDLPGITSNGSASRGELRVYDIGDEAMPGNYRSHWRSSLMAYPQMPDEDEASREVRRCCACFSGYSSIHRS